MSEQRIPTPPQFQDLVGQTFGRWVVLRWDHRTNNRSYWLCRCTGCGIEKILWGSAIKRPSQLRLTCMHRKAPVDLPDMPTACYFQDLTGRIFGQWQVVEWARRCASNGHSYWKCRCIGCGLEKEIVGPDLKKPSNLRKRCEHQFKSTEDRLLDATVRRASGCWEFTGPRFSNGYGKFWVPGRTRLGPHRISYEIFCGPISEGLLVCHHCDNRICINPTHLFLGTVKDNADDMVAKGRSNRGEKNYNAKLSEKDVLDIRRALSAGYAMRELALRYGVLTSSIKNIAIGKSWRHLVTPPLPGLEGSV